MDYKNLLLSHKGRIPRSVYWLNFVLPYLVISVVLNIIDSVSGTRIAIDPNLGAAAGLGILSTLFGLLMIYPSIVVAAKRCHDRGRTGWFQLVLIVPIVQLWPMIEVLFLKGTTGSNKYGDDPLQTSDVPDQPSADQPSADQPSADQPSAE